MNKEQARETEAEETREQQARETEAEETREEESDNPAEEENAQEQQQERQADERHWDEPGQRADPLAEVAGTRYAGGADARRVERRQVVVLGDEVVVLQERAHRRVDDERGEAQVDPQRRHPPPVGA